MQHGLLGEAARLIVTFCAGLDPSLFLQIGFKAFDVRRCQLPQRDMAKARRNVPLDNLPIPGSGTLADAPFYIMVIAQKGFTAPAVGLIRDSI